MITELPADLLQRIFACVLGARGGGRSIPAVCRQWRAAWEDDALWFPHLFAKRYFAGRFLFDSDTNEMLGYALDRP